MIAIVLNTVSHLLVAAAMSVSLSSAAFAQEYDLVINSGRVIDPETRFDAMPNVGVKNGQIEAVTERAIAGEQTIDARGLVVASGFIDPHVHGFDAYGNKLLVRT